MQLTEEETLIHQMHAEGKPASVVARVVGLTRRTGYKALGRQEQAG